ncbi:GNAT family N-acetyltransferase [Maribacter sp. MMG018]|uniref:GNAT family N-acetyltransferase n=1 Tax=Maribacter sp. MMG018 TaxID=2822688 RepID=UPI001B36B198|nr:GNAT family N-acetyltransferase [Maribacter sp. MMG018]MBQ4914904.1 GNAT family N-acetyltransferase [Maribacter sp. MMG018]
MNGILRTNVTNNHFKTLVALLDADLAKRDGKDNTFYAQFNGMDQLSHCIVYFKNEEAVGCGAIKPFDDHCMEIKRMYVKPGMRGNGIASIILTELEKWTKELGYNYCVLETGLRQPEAIALYTKNNYRVTANYPPYEGVDNSVCFKKLLT